VEPIISRQILGDIPSATPSNFLLEATAPASRKLSIEQYHGWGCKALAFDRNEHGVSVLLAHDDPTKKHSTTLFDLAKNPATSSFLEELGIRWRQDLQALEVPLVEELKAYWIKKFSRSGSFEPHAVDSGLMPREEWQQLIAAGQFPISHHGALFNHDLIDHLPAIATIDREYALGFQERMSFLLKLEDRMHTDFPKAFRSLVSKSIKLHEQQFEHGTVFVSYNLGLLPSDPARAERNIEQIVARMQRWANLLGDPESMADLGDVQWCARNLENQLEAIPMERGKKSACLDIINACAEGYSSVQNRNLLRPAFKLPV